MKRIVGAAVAASLAAACLVARAAEGRPGDVLWETYAESILRPESFDRWVGANRATLQSVRGYAGQVTRRLARTCAAETKNCEEEGDPQAQLRCLNERYSCQLERWIGEFLSVMDGGSWEDTLTGSAAIQLKSTWDSSVTGMTYEQLVGGALEQAGPTLRPMLQ